ncbi:MAG: ArsR/SmtB family transcription factor [Clostridia bacterium]
MTAIPNVVEVAALIGDASRAAILLSLLDGRMLPAGELARLARISPQTASSHLSKLVKGGLLGVETHGRHRYYRLSGTQIAQVLEGLATIAPPVQVRSLRQADQSKALCFARTCYDHLAGAVGVKVTEALVERQMLLPGEREFSVSQAGIEWFEALGIQVEPLKRSRRSFARQCLDWSERRHHLAGALGAAYTNALLEKGWVKRMKNTRAVTVTQEGRDGLTDLLGIQWDS